MFGAALQRAMTTIAPSGGLDAGPRIRATAANTVAAKIAQSIKAFWGDTDGVILPYVTRDAGRHHRRLRAGARRCPIHDLQTQLQNGADALALAGAAELDRTPTAIERAIRAIDRLITNCLAADRIETCRSREINFLRSLPARDSDPILPANRTSDPTRAAFVEVTVEPITMRTILPASIFGGSNVLTAGAQAVAGFDQVVCNFTPIFVCNPFETRGMSYAQATEALVNASNDPAGQRKLIRLAGTQKMIRSVRSREFRISHSNDGFFAD